MGNTCTREKIKMTSTPSNNQNVRQMTKNPYYDGEIVYPQRLSCTEHFTPSP